MSGFLADIRIAMRRLSKSPGFVAVVVLTLALGIGANTAVFSGVHFALLETIEATSPGELLWIGSTQADGNTSRTHSYDLYEQLRSVPSPFQGVCAVSARDTAVGWGETVRQLQVGLATPEYFALLGVNAALGRVFGDHDADVAVVVLEHGFWRGHMAADESVLGQSIRVTGKAYTVIGVMPEGFHGLDKESRVALWTPMDRAVDVRPGFDAYRSANWIWLNVFARLPYGADREEAETAANVALKRHVENRIAAWSTPNPKEEAAARASKVRLQSAAYGDPDARERSAQVLQLLGAVVGLILLLACANVANLVFGRASTRRREIAMRLALGAGRVQLVRQLLVESLILAALGGVAGAFLAWLATPWIGLLLDSSEELPLSLPVLAFTAGVSLAAGILFGLAPAWAASDVCLSGWLKGGGVSSRKRALNKPGLLVAVQAALCIPALVATGLLLQTLRNLSSVSPGMAVEQVVHGTVNPQANGYEREHSMRVLEELERRLTLRPEVRSAALGNSTAFMGWTSVRNLNRGDSDEDIHPPGVHYGSR